MMILRSFSQLVLGALALSGLVLAMFELQVAARFSDMSLVSERIELGLDVRPATVQIGADEADEVRDIGACRSDIVLAGSRAVLQRVDISNGATDYAGWWASLVAAEKYLRHALGCLPADGNLWLRYAAIDATIAEGPAKAARLMAISAKFSPADQSDLLARVYFWNRLSAETLQEGAETVRHDVKLVLEQAIAANIAKILPTYSDALLPYLAEAAKELSTQRRADLAWHGVDVKSLNIQQ